MSEHSSELVVIGGGPGGYVAAIRAAQLGMQVTLVEREHLGGICSNWGCIPTKALLASADVVRTVEQAGGFGVMASIGPIDIQKMIQRSRNIADKMAGGVRMLLKKNGVTVIMGSGRLAEPGVVEVMNATGKLRLRSSHIILATGSRARQINGVTADGEKIVTYRGALTPQSIPDKLLVIGSGAIGTEFAGFYSAIGSKVTIVEALDRLVPVEDATISTFLENSLKRQGIEILVSATVSNITLIEGTVSCVISHQGEDAQRTFDKVILAIGILPNTEDIGLEGQGVATDRGLVVIDAFYRTSVKGIYAIGDIVAGPSLAHKASHDAVICIEKICGLDPHPLDLTTVPACTYSHPQIGSIGLTERAAKDLGIDLNVGVFPFHANGKAIALCESEGLVKTIYNRQTGELLGAHVIGAEATEMIATFAVAKSHETTATAITDTVFPHPTLSEMVHESSLAASKQAIHI